MGPKRGQTVQIQTRIENDNQLYEWLKHEGLGCKFHPSFSSMV